MALLRTLTCTPGNDATREAITFTSAVEFDNSFSQLFSRAQRPIYKFEATLAPLMRAEVESISAFYVFHRGSKPFLWNGGAWGNVENYNLVEEGDSVTRKFYLPNRRIGASSIAIQTLRESTGVSSNWLTSSSNSWPYSLSAIPGIITFMNSSNTIPASGDDIFAKYGCQYLCVFDPGGFRTEQVARNVWNAALRVREWLE